jgi:DNA-binding protein YbaB
MGISKEDYETAKDACIEAVNEKINQVSDESKQYIADNYRIVENVKVKADETGQHVTIDYKLVEIEDESSTF